jgi:hypothetical protein
LSLPTAVSAILIRHLDKTEAARPAGFPILDQHHVANGSILLENLANTLLVEREGQIAYVKLRHF